MKDELLFLAIGSLHFLTFREKLTLEKELGTVSDLASLSLKDMSALVGRPVRSRSWRGEGCRALAEQSVKLMEVYGIGSVLHHAAEYPAMAAEIFDPPYMLFYRGQIETLREPCISVVGTRKPSRMAAVAAFDFSKEAAGAGYTMVSGLAFGIDAAVHKGALEGQGKTVAVLPCGADGVAPSSHKRLAAAMLESGGCLISEYLPGVPAEKFRFPQRNRIIAALSAVTVVAAAPEKSGALITAEFALEQGRDVYLLAAGLEDERCRKGMEKYRQDGAPVVATVKDYEEYFSAPPGSVLGGTPAGTRYCRQDKQLYFRG